MEKALGLPQRQTKEQSERACRLNRGVRIYQLSATLTGLGRCPGIDGVLTDPPGDAATIAQRLVIRAPVCHAIRGFVVRMSLGSFVGLRHALHRWLPGLIMSKHDARFSRRQGPMGD